MNDTTPARFRSLTQRLALAVVAIAPALASAACAAPAADADADARADAGPAEQLATGESELRPRLDLNPLTVPVFELGEEPLVKLPAYWDAYSRTSTTIGVGWYEPGGNPQTLLYRQRYDLDGQPVGPETLIKSFTGLPKGNAGFTDSPETSADGAGPETDRLTCYRLVEKSGLFCGRSREGENCVSTQRACAYTQAATPHKVGRVQLRIKTSSAATAAAPGNHVEVRLQSKYFPYALMPIPRKNSTWLDSTLYDFTSGSDITYDLKLGGISDLSDITQITVATPDDDGFCINELELLVDNTRAFFKSFGEDGVGCEWAHKSGEIGGSVVSIPFAELRRSPDWQGFNPPNLGIGSTYASFVGYRAPELIAQLDAVFGDALRNPANGRGDDAGFLNTNWTTTSVDNRRKLHVVQHVIAQDLGWQGNVAADPSYDLVIHHDATCGTKNWCIRVENVEANSSFSGWSSLIPLIGAGIQIAVNSEADGEMQKAMTAMGGSSLNDPPSGLEYCFLTGVGVESPFKSHGFGAGSLTLCFPE